jgi:outer membrane protein assembly factor BamE (lipoprotein component of BamABCDE complex)
MLTGKLVIAVMFVAVLALGCSALTIPTPNDIVKTPLGTETIKIGMTKQQVEALWGKPNDTKMVEDKNRWPSPREVWVYNAQYGSIPVDAGYLSKTKKLYFDGENLTDIGE